MPKEVAYSPVGVLAIHRYGSILDTPSLLLLHVHIRQHQVHDQIQDNRSSKRCCLMIDERAEMTACAVVAVAAEREREEIASFVKAEEWIDLHNIACLGAVVGSIRLMSD